MQPLHVYPRHRRVARAPVRRGATQPRTRSPPRKRAAGWKLLFDGKSLDAWRGYRRDALPEAGWEIKDGTVRTVAKVKGGELITRQTFNDFEFAWEWRVAPGGNNGVKYFVTEERPQSPGHEYQMIDDAGYPGKLHANQHTADFYDVLPAAAESSSGPAGSGIRRASSSAAPPSSTGRMASRSSPTSWKRGGEGGIEKSKFKEASALGERSPGTSRPPTTRTSAGIAT